MTDALDRAEALRLARLYLDTRGVERADAAQALCALLRYRLGYTLPDGSTGRTWRGALQQWTAEVRGLDAPQRGRPPGPVRRDPDAVVLRLSAEARERLEASEDPSALVERLHLPGPRAGGRGLQERRP